jgi:hypothetical protein
MIIVTLFILTISSSILSIQADPNSPRGSPRSLDFLDASTGLPSTGDYNYVAFGNFNGDSYVDIAIGGEDYGSATTLGLYAYTGNGGTSWTATTGLPTTDTFGGLAFGDADGDGNTEIFAAYEGKWGTGAALGVGAWEYSGGTWSAAGITSPYTSGDVDNIHLEDINGSSGLDLIVATANSGLRYYQGSGSSPISWVDMSSGLPTGGEYTAIDVIDINKDGRKDIVAGDYNGGEHIFIQPTSGNPWGDYSASITVTGTPLGVAVGDVNNDTHMDIVWGTAQAGMSIRLGNSGGVTGTNFVWTTPTLANQGLPTSGTTDRYSQIQLVDIDKDSDLDILGPKGTGSGGLHLFLGNGSMNPGTNLAWTELLGAGLPTSGAYYGSNYADFDNDGDMDIGGCTWWGGSGAWLNNLTIALPTVTSTNPVDGATDVPITTEINATFSKPMLGSTFTASTFIIKDSSMNNVAGQIMYDIINKTVKFQPTSDLKIGETYEAAILSSVTDIGLSPLDGNGNGTSEGSPEDDYVWNFTTSWNLPPSLTNFSVTPTTGDISTEFEYSVIYWDQNDDSPEILPAYIKLFLDDEIVGRAMTLNSSALPNLRDGDYTNGEQYTYKTTLTSYGLHNYSIECFDGVDGNDTTIIDNPMVQGIPVIDPILDQTAIEDTDLKLDLRNMIHDGDTSLSALNLTVNSSYGIVNDFNITFNYPNEFNYPSGRTYEIVAINVTDHIFNVSRDVMINVMAVNDAPQIDSIPNLNVYEDVDYFLDVTSLLSDIDNDLDELTVSTNSTHASVVGKNITFSYSAGDNIVYEYVKIEVTDGDLTDHQNITVTVIPEGILYVILPIPVQNAVEEIDLVLDISDYLSLGINVTITDFSFAINSSYGIISGTQFTFNYPNSFNYPSGLNYEYVRVDITFIPEGKIETTEFKINVLPVNDAPWLTTPDVDPASGDEDDTFTFTVKYFDIDGSDDPEINVVIDDSPYEMTYISGNKNLITEGAQYQFPTGLFEGVHTYYFECDDMAGEINSYNSTASFGLTVTEPGVEPPPVDQDDTDKDGIPDDWEKDYGLDPDDPSDASLDSDGDNFTNLEEYLGFDGKPGGGDDTSPIDGTDFPHEVTSNDEDDDDSDDSGLWLMIGILLIVVVIVIIVVAVVVMKRKKPEPEYYPHPPATEELEEIAPPPMAAPVEGQPQQDYYYPPAEDQPIAPTEPVPPEQPLQPEQQTEYQYPPQEEQPLPPPLPEEQLNQEQPVGDEYAYPPAQEPLLPPPEQSQPEPQPIQPAQAQPAPAAPAPPVTQAQPAPAVPAQTQPAAPEQPPPVQQPEGTEPSKPQPTTPTEEENQ